MNLTQNNKFAKFSPKIEIFSNFYEIWQPQEMEDANYECNTRQCLEGYLKYCLRTIIGS